MYDRPVFWSILPCNFNDQRVKTHRVLHQWQGKWWSIKGILHVILRIHLHAWDCKTVEYSSKHPNSQSTLSIWFFDFFRVEHDFSEIVQPIMMSLFTWSLFGISGAMLIIQVQIVKHLNFVEMNNVFQLLQIFFFLYFFTNIILVAPWKCYDFVVTGV